MADDVENFIKNRNLEKPVLLGHSMLVLNRIIATNRTTNLLITALGEPKQQCILLSVLQI